MKEFLSSIKDWAAKNKNTEMGKLLLDKTTINQDMVFKAGENGWKNIIIYYKNDERKSLNFLGYEGKNLLMIAKSSTYMYCYDEGIDLNESDKAGKVALMYPAIVKFLIDKGDDVNETPRCIMIELEEQH